MIGTKVPRRLLRCFCSRCLAFGKFSGVRAANRDS